VPHSKQGRDRHIILSRHPDLNSIAHALDQVAEPESGLGKQPMTPPRNQEEAVKLIGKLLGVTHLIRELLFFCTPNSSLDAVFVESLKNPVQARLQVELMQAA
jgi:hypothetical protein